MKYVLPILVGVPFIAAILQALFARGSRAISVVASVGSSVLALLCVLNYRPVASAGAFDFSVPWIEYFNISFNLGIDGLSLFPMLLVAWVMPTLVLACGIEESGIRGRQGLLLLLQSALFGTVCSKDLFVMFFFWAFAMAPIYFLVVVWGEKDRVAVAFRYLVYSALGSVFMLVAFLVVYLGVEPHSFILGELTGARAVEFAKHTTQIFQSSFPTSSVAFGLLVISFILRMGIWPAHQWAFRFFGQAPSSVLVSHSALIMPISIYLFARLGLELFPAELVMISKGVMILGAANLLVGAFYSVGQRDLRGVLSSLMLMQAGTLLLGVGSTDLAGLMGASIHIFGGGAGLAGFAFLVGLVVSRVQSSGFVDDENKVTLGGLIQQAPVFSAVSALIFCSLVGLPGFSGFVGNSMVWMGGAKVWPVGLAVAILSGLLMLVALVSLFRDIYLGSAKNSATFKDLSPLEKGFLLPLLAAILFMGLYPSPFLEQIRPTLQTFLSLTRP